VSPEEGETGNFRYDRKLHDRVQLGCCVIDVRLILCAGSSRYVLMAGGVCSNESIHAGLQALLPGHGSYEILKGKEFLNVPPDGRREHAGLPARHNSWTNKVDGIPGLLNHLLHPPKGKKP
jgi:hypothetical protein